MDGGGHTIAYDMGLITNSQRDWPVKLGGVNDPDFHTGDDSFFRQVAQQLWICIRDDT